MNIAAVTSLLALPDPPLWVVTAQSGARRGGLIATTVFSLSIVPELPRMLVTLARQHHTWELVDGSQALALHLIDEEHLDWVWRFAPGRRKTSSVVSTSGCLPPRSRRRQLQRFLRWPEHSARTIGRPVGTPSVCERSPT